METNNQQTFFDIAILATGSAIRANDIAQKNGCSVTDSPASNVKTEQEVVNATIVAMAAAASSQIATAVAEYCFANEFNLNFR